MDPFAVAGASDRNSEYAETLIPETVALADATDQTLVRFHALMEISFLPEELMTYEELNQARQDASMSGTILLADDQPIAGIVTEEFQDGRVILLAYLLVAVSARGMGLGSRLMADLITRRGESRSLILAEIEDPRFHSCSVERGDPEARVRFYDRCGARLLPLAYAQPSLRVGAGRVDQLLLIAIGADGDDVDGGLVVAFLDEYYEGCEGAERVRHDPAFAALRTKAYGDEHGRLLLHRLSDLASARPGPSPEETA